jgi:cellulose synthase operon protein YhjQ
MGLYGKDSQEDLPTPDGSEDASASSWANLHGNKYRDFSASRRESCVPLRHRAAQQTVRDHEMSVNAEAKAVLHREERGSAQPLDAVQGQGTRYTGSERRRGVLQASRPENESSSTDGQRRVQDNRGNVPGAVRQIYREPRHDDVADLPQVQELSVAGPVSPFSEAFVGTDSTRGVHEEDHFHDSPAMPRLDSRQPPSVTEEVGPAWLYATSEPKASSKPPLTSQAAVPQPSVADTLQQSRERVAARWFALKGAFEHPDEPLPIRQKETRTPVLAVFSLAGGVGKTSLVATVGRALSSMGEKVLLTDTTSHGLLPFYFGANELRHGTVRTFSPPSGSVDAPIYLVSHDMEEKGRDEETRERFVDEVIGNSQGTHRILLDLTAASSWVISQMSRMNPTVLIPVAPDMNSVISLQFVEKFFYGISDSEGRPLQPYYLLNQFDTSLPLHLDVREVLRRQLGERLLPFVIHRAHAVSEALAEGMTVMDYVPREPIAQDYAHVATWLRSIAAPTMAGFRSVRWTESEA